MFNHKLLHNSIALLNYKGLMPNLTTVEQLFNSMELLNGQLSNCSFTNYWTANCMELMTCKRLTVQFDTCSITRHSTTVYLYWTVELYAANVRTVRLLNSCIFGQFSSLLISELKKSLIKRMKLRLTIDYPGICGPI